MGEASDRLEQRHDARVAEAQRGDSLTRFNGRLLQAVERVLGKDTLMAHALDFEELPIDLVPELTQVRQGIEAPFYVENFWGVCRRFCSPRRLLFLNILHVVIFFFYIEGGV